MPYIGINVAVYNPIYRTISSHAVAEPKWKQFQPEVAGGEAVAVEGAVGSVARIVADFTGVALYLVSDIETVRVHQTVLDA